MRYFNRAAIFIAVLFWELSGLVSAETLYRPDSSKVEFTMGCCYNTIEFYPESTNYIPEVSFGPIFLESVNVTSEVEDSGLTQSNFISSFPGEPYLVPFKREFLNKYLKDKIGDTVLVIWREGSFRGIITEIGKYYGYELEYPICRLKALKMDLRNNLHLYNPIIVLRHRTKYRGPLIHFEEYVLIDSTEILLADSLKKALVNKWIAWAKTYPDRYDDIRINETISDSTAKTITCFRNTAGTNKDTAIWVVNFQTMAAAAELMMYRIIKNGDNTSITELHFEHDNGEDITIHYATDINGDGNLEYLIQYFDGICYDDVLYELKNGQYNHISDGCMAIN
jgi:hypothetical protein